MDTLAPYQRAQQALKGKQAAELIWELPTSSEDAAATSSNAYATHSSQAQEAESSLGRQDLLVFRLPSLQIKLPTDVGIVSFSPVFLSKDQLDRTRVRQTTHAVYIYMRVHCFVRSGQGA